MATPTTTNFKRSAIKALSYPSQVLVISVTSFLTVWPGIPLQPSFGLKFSGIPKRSKSLLIIPSINVLRIRAWKIRIAQYIPSLPISVAIISSLSYRGVVSDVLASTELMILPSHVYSPTTIHKNHPCPV
jgi:hypothetical protein